MKRLLLTLLLVGVGFLVQGQVVLNFSLTQPAAPGASFSSTSNLLQVDFTDGSTGTIASWAWDFGDGNTATTQNPTHTYATDGQYVVCLTVTDAINCTSTSCDTISVIGTDLNSSIQVNGLEVHPNPFDVSTQATFTLPASTDLKVTVTDLVGRHIETLYEGKAAAGNHRFDFGRNYPAGTYFLVIGTPTGNTVHRIIANH